MMDVRETDITLHLTDMGWKLRIHTACICFKSLSSPVVTSAHQTSPYTCINSINTGYLMCKFHTKHIILNKTDEYHVYHDLFESSEHAKNLPSDKTDTDTKGYQTRTATSVYETGDKCMRTDTNRLKYVGPL